MKNISNACTVTEKGTRNKTIRISWYGDNGKKIISNVDDFYDYFYVPIEEKIDDKISHLIKDVDASKEYVSWKGKKLKKIVLKKLRFDDKKEVCNSFEDVYEDDVPLHIKYMRDNNLKFTKTQRIIYLDIETFESTDEVNTPEPIICICVYDSFSKKYHQFVWHKEISTSVEKSESKNTYYFNNEESMLEDFLTFISFVSPDIYTGWFANHFDLPYIMNRCVKLEINKNKLSPLGFCYLKEDKPDHTKKEQYKKEKEHNTTIIWGSSV
ncbi:MAG: hypothetical protein EHM34_09680, partial [Nitrosopumilales archaeon]